MALRMCPLVLLCFLLSPWDFHPLVVVDAQATQDLRQVNLVVTKAPLLGGGLRECATQECHTGGVAAVQALVRYYDNNNESMNNTLVIPEADFKSPLTFMSQFYLGVNLMIFRNTLQWRAWTLPSYTIRVNRFPDHTVKDMQQANFPAVLSNILLSPDYQSFFGYVEPIHWDKETHMAIIYVGKDEKPAWELDAAASAKTLIRYVHKRNAVYGCPYAPVETIPSLAAFAQVPFDEWYEAAGPTTELPPQQQRPANLDECFLPIVVYDFEGKVFERATVFWEAMLSTTDPMEHPALLLDARGMFLEERDEDKGELFWIRQHTNRMWVASHASAETEFFRVQMEVLPSEQTITNIAIQHDSLVDLPLEVAQSPEYLSDSHRIRQYAREAYEKSLVEEVGAMTATMPATVATDQYRYCNVQECEFGNLAADALRWKQGSDIAIMPSFFFQGAGWPAGEARYLELNENLNYVGQRCAGVMTGLSIHRALEYSVSQTTFDGYYESRNPLLNKEGLFQVSGMRYTFNNLLEGEKILSIDIWDKTRQSFQPLERTKLYTFVSGTHLCNTFKGFPPYLTDLLTAEGEVPGERVTDQTYVDDIKEYLLEFYSNQTYTPQVDGRLRNDSSNTNAMPLIDRDDCEGGAQYWSTTELVCMECPSFESVDFSMPELRLKGTVFKSEVLHGDVHLMNNEDFPILVHLQLLAVPSYTVLDIQQNSSDGNHTYLLSPGESLIVNVSVDTTDRPEGTDTSSLVFDIYPTGAREDCPNYPIRHGIIVQMTLPSDGNYLKGVAAFGYVSAAVIILTSIYFAGWVWWNRKLHVVLSMQPPFLLTLSFGVVLIAAAIIPLSIDDQVASQRGCDIACMVKPWLLSVGLTVSTSALFTKLWRINRLLNGTSFRRRKIRERDAIGPLVTIIVLNIVFLTIWTVVDPLRWERFSVEGQRWKTYGKCSFSNGNVGAKMMICIIVLCAVSFLALGWQAFKARNISTEFSETKYLGIAVFSWMQLSVVGIPVMFLVEESNVVARYGLSVGLLLTVCMSMLLLIFLPILYVSNRPIERGNVRVSGMDMSSSFMMAKGQRERSNGPLEWPSPSKKLLFGVGESSRSQSSFTPSRNGSSAAIKVRGNNANNPRASDMHSMDDSCVVEEGKTGVSVSASGDEESPQTSPTAGVGSDDNFAGQSLENVSE